MATWMVVEDEPDLYDMVMAMYDTLGVEGVSFAEGEEAFDWIDEVDKGYYQGELPELVLLDIRLPGSVDGTMVGERLRKSPRLKNIVIVIMTANRLSPEDEREIMTRTAAESLIYKPLPKLTEFKQMLNDLLQNGKSSAMPEPMPEDIMPEEPMLEERMPEEQMPEEQMFEDPMPQKPKPKERWFRRGWFRRLWSDR